MWRTSTGERTLEKGEAESFKLGASIWFEEMTGGTPYLNYALGGIDEAKDMGGQTHNVAMPKYFADLSIERQVIAMATVTKAMLDPNIQPPELTAWNEATIAVVFKSLKFQIQFEIDSYGEGLDREEFDEDDDISYKTGTRSLASDFGYLATEQHEVPYVVVASETDMSEWCSLLETLQDGILWDNDYETLEFVGHGIDYYEAKAPEYTEELYVESAKYLLELSQEFRG